MIPASFAYHRATDLDDAIRLLGEHDGASLLAGGHSLIPMMKARLARPGALIDIGRVEALRGIRDAGDAIRIGALTPHAELQRSELVTEHAPLWAQAAHDLADRQVRNRGTVGGNIAHADPASDLPAVAVATGATIHLAGPGGERAVPAGNFFVGLFTTGIRSGEVLTAIEVPKPAPRTGTCYEKFAHPASGYAVVGAAVVVVLNEDGSCREARLCFNGLTVSPLDATSVTDALAGGSLDDATIAGAVDAHLSVDDPMGDVFASGPYRVEMAKVYGRRALQKARDAARS
ncbi:MAG: FAD binding domain-containing protein [Gemmatimonadota bacterium]